MTLWTVRNSERQLSNAWTAPRGIVLRHHNGPREFQSECKTLKEALQQHEGTHWHPHDSEEAEFEPGEYYPRMQRVALDCPNQELPSPRALYSREFASSLQSARNLFAQLREVFRYIEPAKANDSAYGDQIRSLLILACTEVESAWRAVLLANDGASPRDQLSTRQYVKLAAPMRLNDWRVRLDRFPDYHAVAPFEGWDPSAPTQTLSWYDVYNRTKHDRETNLSHATLQHMLAAMCGVYVMLAAQWGAMSLFGIDSVAPDWFFTSMPDWRLAELYVPPLGDYKRNGWRKRAFFQRR